MSDVETAIVAIEQGALRRWCAGDPSGFLELCDDDVVYFDPFLDRRLDGRAALAAYYESLRGKLGAARFEMLDPKVQRLGDAAVLTYNFVSYGGDEDALRWNCTEVFRRCGETWKLAQTHWSFTRGRRG
ncbi:MAG: nuclear transport factor 2 family protein [Roseiarcus sp.]|jgi:ketosteroid isomerase-like protein